MKALLVPTASPTGPLVTSDPARQLPGDHVAPATDTSAGTVLLADTAPPAVSAVGALGSETTVAREDHTHAHGAQSDPLMHSVAVPSGAAGFLSGADKAKLDGVASGAQVNASANVGTAPAAISTDVFDGSSGATQNFSRVRQGRGMRVRKGSQLIVVDREPSFMTRQLDLPRALTVSGSKVAGATLRPNLTGDVDPAIQNGSVVHDGENLFPFMTWATVDFYGYPHHKYVQMLNGNATDLKVSRGYEAGQEFKKGDMVRRPGRGARYEVRGLLRNLGWADAFVEFVLEPNPSAGTLEGANRMRFLSGELGFLTTSDVLLTFWCELAVRSAAAYSWEGGMRAYSSSGALLMERCSGGHTTSGFNWIRSDCKLQLRWRVDRIANLDLYNDDFQGSNQGANELRLDVLRLKFQPVGFEPLTECADG